MAKVIRLNENDIERLVKKIIREDSIKEAKQRRVKPRFDAVEFFYSMAGTEDLIETIGENEGPLEGGGIFTEEEFLEWVFAHSGDRDYDDDLGSNGWADIEDNIDRLAQLYLNDLTTKDYSAFGWSEDELYNIENSLREIIGEDGEDNPPTNQGPKTPIEPRQPVAIVTKSFPFKNK